jgi:threonine synthase
VLADEGPAYDAAMPDPAVTATRIEMNPALSGLQCIRCETTYPLVDLPGGCPRCAAAGAPASLTALYAGLPSSLAPAGDANPWGAWLPYRQSLSLGEGNTPLIELPHLARELGVRRLSAKNEGMNPTGSHKDRMSAQAVTRALDVGAATVVLASSGNAAVSAATYCAAAGLDCEVATYGDLAAPFVRALALLGARRIGFASGHDRWRHVQRRVEEDGAFALTNFSLPAVGSPVFGVEGYKAIAIECAAQGPLAEHILVPTARGDLLWGLHAGFGQLLQAGLIERRPKLWAVEPFARLSRVLAGEALQGEFPGSTEQFSIAGSTVTFQQLKAVQESRGGAVVVHDTQARTGVTALAREGLWGELCAGATVAALGQLLQRGAIGSGAHVMLLFTARGDRDPA